MPVDWSNAVLAPNMKVFAVAATIDPLASQPGTVPYPARGIIGSRAVLVQLADGSMISSNETTLGIRESEFPVLPARGDRCTIADEIFWVSDVQRDRQGGSKLALRGVNDI